VYDEESLTEEGVLRSDEAEMMAFLSEESEDDW
jgi:hypothetical protein